MATAKRQMQGVLDEPAIQAVTRDFPSLIKMLESLERTRTNAQRRQTHLAKHVVCQDCLRSGVRRDLAIWVPTKSRISCPRCGSKRSTSAKRMDPFIDKYLPRIIELEQALRKEAIEIVQSHPIWTTWAQGVKGLGAITLGKIMGHCDIERLETATQMWAHAGLGLIKMRVCNKCGKQWSPDLINTDSMGRKTEAKTEAKTKRTKMIKTIERDRSEITAKACPSCGCEEYVDLGVGRQKKIAGQYINYDAKLQSITCVLGESLLRAQGKYYALYADWKDRFLAEGLTKGHAHNRAFRHMRKLIMAHIYEVWRRVEGLPVRPPYAMEYLGHSTEITPEQMVESTTPR